MNTNNSKTAIANAVMQPKNKERFLRKNIVMECPRCHRRYPYKTIICRYCKVFTEEIILE